MQICAYSQLWRGFSPPGTSLRDTVCIWWIFLLCDSIELTIAEKLSQNIEVYLFLDPCPVSSAVTWFTYRQLAIWINTASRRIIKVRDRWGEFWILIMEMAEKYLKKIGLGANGKQANACGEQNLSWTFIYLYYQILTSDKERERGKKLKMIELSCKHILCISRDPNVDFSESRFLAHITSLNS